ncbi:MAG: BT4734/BF3469 family protein [Bacteroidota bacterium]|nr:BT4734/BF3469 family protein [Bacteroidota bacterium]
METISKEQILNKTHYGLRIYAHILNKYYPNELVLRLEGRVCPPTKNPFNENKPTLNVFINKENILGNVFDKELAHHFDSENSIPKGDVFCFAEIHYNKSGDDLLQAINNDMGLRLNEDKKFYSNIIDNAEFSSIPQIFMSRELPTFSFFRAPVNNVFPNKEVNLIQVYNAIKGEEYKQITEMLRGITNTSDARRYKCKMFDHCTFSGRFKSRKKEEIIQQTCLICLDMDHVSNLEVLRQKILNDEYFETQLLFISPSGDGLKWIIEIDLNHGTHEMYFDALKNYMLATYSVEVDKGTGDISRTCFLCHDPNVYINPKLLNNYEK